MIKEWTSWLAKESVKIRSYRANAHEMKKTQQDKMALIFLIVDRFGSLNMHIDSVFSSDSAGVIGVLFGCTVQTLSAKRNCCICSN